VPEATTVRLKLAPLATVVSAAGWFVIIGAITPDPLLLEEEDELDEDDELELLDELELDEDDELLPELDASVVTFTAEVRALTLFTASYAETEYA